MHRIPDALSPEHDTRIFCFNFLYVSCAGEKGVCDLLDAARGSPHRVLPSLPVIMRSVRVAISCKNPEALVFVCTALRTLASGNKEVPYRLEAGI